jgi:hypothetical protein
MVLTSEGRGCLYQNKRTAKHYLRQVRYRTLRTVFTYFILFHISIALKPEMVCEIKNCRIFGPRSKIGDVTV